jgi:hypothetical protein
MSIEPTNSSQKAWTTDKNLAVSNNYNGNRSHGRWNMNLSPAYSGIIFNIISGIMHLSFSRLNNHPWLCYHKRHVIGLSCILHFIISLLYVIIMCLCCYLSSRQFLQPSCYSHELIWQLRYCIIFYFHALLVIDLIYLILPLLLPLSVCLRPVFVVDGH